MKQKLSDRKAVKEALRRKAQANEYMFALLRENARLDENIGVDFININRTSLSLAPSLEDVSLGSTASFESYHRSIELPPESPMDVCKSKNRLSSGYSLNSKNSETLRSLKV